MLTTPIPMPPMILYMTRSLNPVHRQQPIAETLNSTADIKSVFFLPKKSLITPANATPIIEPTRAQPTYQPLLISLRPNCEHTSAVVPEMTAVSYPNRIPPNAATRDRKII